MAADELTYDPQLDVTAGELRASGIAVPPGVPDCGHVPRSSIFFWVGDCETDTVALKMGFKATFHKPFRWITVPLII